MSGFEHIGLFYERPADAADRLATAIDDDLRHDRAVLVCLPHRLRDMVTDRVDPARITVMDDTIRYARPIDAMSALWSFAQRNDHSSTAGVHSIGQIAYDGSPSDAQWHWYEAAVNDVFAGHALKATCLFDLRAIPRDVVPAACATHPIVDGLDVADQAEATVLPERQRVAVPDRRPELHLPAISSSAAARAALRRAAADLPPGVLQRAELVLSETVTNAVVHGAGHADVAVWVDPDGLTIEVADDGAGCADPFVSLRPPQLPVRGAGLWVCHLESSQFSLTPRRPQGTTVTARVD